MRRRFSVYRLLVVVGVLLGWGAPQGTAQTGAAVEPLPYDRTSPVIYDNDGAVESGFTDYYIMALASRGAIRLKGIITTCSYAEEARTPPFLAVPPVELVRERQELVEKARRSGLRHLPDVTAGCSLSLKRPASGRIEDTVPYGSPGARLIVREARRATPRRPLVIIMGGQATSVVDAYLLDPSVADKMVLAWLVGNKRPDGNLDALEYNAGVDPWATYLAFLRLRVVAFPLSSDAAASVPRARLAELPDTELRQTMLESRWPRGEDVFSVPEAEYDAAGAFAMMRRDYVLRTKRVSFDHWEAAGDARVQLPFFRDDPRGRVLVAWEASAAVATEEWWRALKDRAAWGQSQGEVPFAGRPQAIPGSIEAGHFDHGGTGRAYLDHDNNFTRAAWLNPIRVLEHVDIVASPSAHGGYAVTRTEAGEWMEYTIRVATRGTYTVTLRVRSVGRGGTCHLEFDGVDKTGSLALPDTGDQGAWQLVSAPKVALRSGRQVMRLVMDSNGPRGTVGEFDSIAIRPAGSD